MSAQISDPAAERMASIAVRVVDAEGDRAVVARALVGLYRAAAPATSARAIAAAAAVDPYELPAEAVPVAQQRTDASGSTTFSNLPAGHYVLRYLHLPRTAWQRITARAGCTHDVCLEPVIKASLTTDIKSSDCTVVDCRVAQQGDVAVMNLNYARDMGGTIVASAGTYRLPGASETQTSFSTALPNPGRTDLALSIQFPLLAMDPAAAAPGAPAELRVGTSLDVLMRPATPVTGNLNVSMTRTETEASTDVPLWTAIRNGTEALSFNNYLRFIELLFCTEDGERTPGFDVQKARYRNLRRRRFLPFTDTDSYRVLKAATEAFVMVNCAVLDSPDRFNPQADNRYLDRRDLPSVNDLPGTFESYLETVGGQAMLPYLALVRRKLPDIPVTGISKDDANLCVGIIQDKLAGPCLVELIWSYWNEEAMLVQTMNAVTRRFQNVRSPVAPDPLANLEIDPLRPLNNLIWGYTQDEQHRLTVSRRNHEYDHHYGLRLHGRAVEMFRPADTRSQFLEAFHHLLRLCTSFYRQDDDTTVKADAFPVLNALKEVHLVMSQGAHNQFGDLPSTARIEMLMQQWLLGRPEFREFLPTRIMVAYPEPWMDRVDAMKKLQGWTDTSVVHFRNLAIFGEQLLLSIRYGAWSEVFEPTQAFNWARFWRPQIQGYIHAYRAATGVDLGGDTGDAAADSTLPSLLLQRRLAVQRRIA